MFYYLVSGLFIWFSEVGGGVASGMPTPERQEVSAPSWETCLRLFCPQIASSYPLSTPPFSKVLCYLFGIFKLSSYPARCVQGYEPSGLLRRTSIMLKQPGKVGAIRRNVHGKACPYCGSRTYQLVLRSIMKTQMGKLFARCSQCQRPREIDEDLSRILWM